MAAKRVHAEILVHPRRLFGALYLLTKFRGDLICCFKITTDLIFRRYAWLENAYSCPKMFFGGFYPK